MSPTWRLLLATVPLTAYLIRLGLWRGGRTPRVVVGAVDLGWLAFGLVGLFSFGPIGDALISALFPEPNLWSRLVLASSWGLVSLLLGPWASRRLVIYNVVARAVGPAVRSAIDELDGEFVPTLEGFEDAEAGRGVRLQAGTGSSTVVVEAYGRDPAGLIAVLAPAIRDRLGDAARPASLTRVVWFAFSGLTLLVPLLGLLLSRPQVRGALRALLGRIQGG